MSAQMGNASLNHALVLFTDFNNSGSGKLQGKVSPNIRINKFKLFFEAIQRFDAKTLELFYQHKNAKKMIESSLKFLEEIKKTEPKLAAEASKFFIDIKKECEAQQQKAQKEKQYITSEFDRLKEDAEKQSKDVQEKIKQQKEIDNKIEITKQHTKTKVLPQLKEAVKKRVEQKQQFDTFEKQETKRREKAPTTQEDPMKHFKKISLEQQTEKKVLSDVRNAEFRFSHKINLKDLCSDIKSKYDEKHKHSFLKKNPSRDAQLAFLKAILTRIDDGVIDSNDRNKIIKGMILYTQRAIDNEKSLFPSGLKKVLEETLKGLKLENVDATESIDAVHKLLSGKNFKLKVFLCSDERLKDIKSASQDTVWIKEYDAKNRKATPKNK